MSLLDVDPRSLDLERSPLEAWCGTCGHWHAAHAQQWGPCGEAIPCADEWHTCACTRFMRIGDVP